MSSRRVNGSMPQKKTPSRKTKTRWYTNWPAIGVWVAVLTLIVGIIAWRWPRTPAPTSISLPTPTLALAATPTPTATPMPPALTPSPTLVPTPPPTATTMSEPTPIPTPTPTFTSSVPSFSISLNAGWSLISLPLIPNDTSIESVLSTVLSNVVSVWRYDAASASWVNYVPGLGGRLTTMEDGKGYWINMKALATLTISGSAMPHPPAMPPTYSVVPGYNQIGFKSMTANGVRAYLAGTNYRFPIYAYASDGYFQISSDGYSLQPGKGYWVYFNAAGTITP